MGCSPPLVLGTFFLTEITRIYIYVCDKEIDQSEIWWRQNGSTNQASGCRKGFLRLVIVKCENPAQVIDSLTQRRSLIPLFTGSLFWLCVPVHTSLSGCNTARWRRTPLSPVYSTLINLTRCFQTPPPFSPPLPPLTHSLACAYNGCLYVCCLCENLFLPYWKVPAQMNIKRRL